jgi:two-component system phosphate regulon sensor histidine kinase PhoR
MVRTIEQRLTATYLLIIVLVLMALGAILSVTLRQYYIDNVESSLEQETMLAASFINKLDFPQGDRERYLENIADTITADINARVTIIDTEGKVLTDSLYDASQLGRHDGRPEVLKALRGEKGITTRYSETAGEQWVYVAVPFENQDIKGVVRLSRSLATVEAVYYRLLMMIIMAIVVIGMLAFLVSTRMAANFVKPIKDLTVAVEEIARGNCGKRIAYKQKDELGLLSAAVNELAADLAKNLREISKVKNRLEAVLNNTINGIFMVDPDARIIYANPKSVKMLDMGDNFQDKKHIEVIKNSPMLEAIDEARRMLHPIKKEIQLFFPAERFVEANVFPISKDDLSAYEGILIVLNDITELKRLERVRRDFVANVSHELKTPVASISGFAETLMNECENESQNIREFSRIIFKEACRLSQLINRLLELSRMESGKSGLKIQDVDIYKVIQDAVELVGRDRKDLLINIEKPAETLMIECDRDLILQVVLNLLENAIAYSPDQEPIHISVEDLGDKVKVMVSDRGEGIPEGEADRIFERFYRVDKTRSRKTGGTGLGLSIVKHLVENHNGTTGVDSKPGEGSTFYFVLPKKYTL